MHLALFTFLSLKVISMPRCHIVGQCALNPVTPAERRRPEGAWVWEDLQDTRLNTDKGGRGGTGHGRESVCMCLCRQKFLERLVTVDIFGDGGWSLSR